MFNAYCCSVSNLCLTLCNPMDCSLPGFPALHCLLEFSHTYVHWVGDAIQPSHPLLSASPPALNISQHQGTEIISKNKTGLKFTYIKKKGGEGSFSLKNSVVALTFLFYREENMSFWFFYLLAEQILGTCHRQDSLFRNLESWGLGSQTFPQIILLPGGLPLMILITGEKWLFLTSVLGKTS